jgi:hypothetical protein
VTGGWRELNNKELHNVYSSPEITITMAGHAEHMREKRNAYRCLVGKTERKKLLGSPRRRLEDDCNIDLREIGWGGMDWNDWVLDSGGLL